MRPKEGDTFSEKMPAQIIWGRKIAAQVYEEIKERLKALNSRNVQPCLAAIRVGYDPAAEAYAKEKARAACQLGISFRSIVLPENTSEKELVAKIADLNNDEAVHGIVVQLPLPRHIDAQKVAESLDPLKDVDCLHPLNMGRLMLGEPYLLPCTPYGVWQLLLRSGISPEGKHVVICGRSNVVGKPLFAILIQKKAGANATVTVCHTGTRNLSEITRQADILVVAIGAPRAVTADMVREGAVVVDVGINVIPDPAKKRGFSVVGDTDFAGILEKASAITPVPGGVGPVTTAMLMWNTVVAAETQTIKCRG